jgi:hypothetical protein
LTRNSPRADRLRKDETMITSDTLNAIEEEVAPLLRNKGWAATAERYLKASAALRIRLLQWEAGKAIEAAKKEAQETTGATTQAV